MAAVTEDSVVVEDSVVAEGSAAEVRADVNSADPPVLVDRDGAGVAVVTLNRPGRRNALTRELKEALRHALTDVGDDAGVRAVVLAGSGPAFCVGQDLAEHAQSLRADAGSALDTVERDYNPIVTALTGMPKPVVAAVNGTCVGAGLGFALACDLRVAAEGARFATAFVGIGLTADSGLSATLVHSLGASRAAELMLLGEQFTAEQAQQWGLVRAVVPADRVVDEAVELARRLAAGPTAAYAEIKKALAFGAVSPLPAVLAAEAAAQVRLARTRDHAGAVEAFLDKRRPEFEGA